MRQTRRRRRRAPRGGTPPVRHRHRWERGTRGDRPGAGRLGAPRSGRRRRAPGGPHRRAVRDRRDAGRADRGVPAAVRVSGVIVARPEAELRPASPSMVDELATRRRWVGSDAIELDPTRLGPGYARPTAEAEEATALLARTEGLLVDPIYTAKALAALIAGVRSGAWDGETRRLLARGRAARAVRAARVERDRGDRVTPRRTAMRRAASSGHRSAGRRRHTPAPRRRTTPRCRRA